MASNEIEIPGSTATVGKLKKIAAGRALDRRRFLATLGMTGAAAGAGLLSGCSSSTTAMTAGTASLAQTDVLAFALNLEYLEATFYSYITQGTDLPSSATFNSGIVTGAPGQLTFTGANAQQITDMLNEIYFDEISHVTALINLLSSSVVPRPAINLAAAGAITAANAISISRMFEDVGVTAYAGAVTALSTSSLTFASQILAVEGFHSGALRLVSVQQAASFIQADAIDVPPADLGSAAAAAAGPTASGGFFATAGAVSTNVPAGYPPTPQGFAFARTASEVLAIVYGAGTPAAPGTSSGGFFPKGVNGRIKTV
jgi:hypothetical protein